MTSAHTLPCFSYQTMETIKSLSETTIKNLIKNASWLECAERSIEFITPKGTFSNILIPGNNPTNGVAVSGKTIGLKCLSSKQENTAGALAIAAITSKLGLGAPTSIALWHSGFHITITPPKMNDIVTLLYTLMESEVKLGLATQNLVFSNHTVVFVEKVLNFIESRIISTSLVLPSNKSISEYIDNRDLYLITLGLCKSMYPNGFNITKSCKYNYELNEDNSTPVCSYTEDYKIDLKELEIVLNSKLTPEMTAHMLKNSPNAMTLEDVKTYKDTLDKISPPHKIEITHTNGLKITIEYKTPTVAEYIADGKVWCNELIEQADDILAVNDTLNKDDILNRLVSTLSLTTYASYVKCIYTDTDVIDEPGDIRILLSNLSNMKSVIQPFFNGVKEHMDNTTVAIVAVEDFVCPECKKKQQEKQLGDFGSNYIPINVFRYFLVLGVESRTSIIKEVSEI